MHLVFGVITLEQHICRQILYFMYHFMRESVANKLLEIRFVSTKDQITDEFTKTSDNLEGMVFLKQSQHGVVEIEGGC
jgi:hypothetical protein